MGETTSNAALAALLVSCERELSEQRPAAVRVPDDSDESLARALVAAKLLIPLEAAARARNRSSANGRVIAALAET